MRSLILVALLVGSLAAGSGCSDPQAEVEQYRARAEAALAEGRLPAAIVEFKNILRIDPNDAAAHFGLARAYLAGRQPREAFWELQETVRLAPENRDARLQYARLLLSGGAADREEALVQVDTVLEQDAGNWSARLLKGKALAALGRADEARAEYEAAATGAPGEAAPLLVLAEFHRERGERESAEQNYRALVAMKDDAFAWNALAGFLAVDRRHDDEAEAAYRRSLELAPRAGRVDAHVRLATFLLSRDRSDEAEALLLQAIEVEEGALPLTFALARLYVATGDAERADAMLVQAAAERPGDPQPLLFLSDFRSRRGDAEGALAAAEQALEAKPRDSAARLRKAELLLELASQQDADQRIAQGRAVVEAVLATDPGQPEALLVKGRILLAERKPEEAAESFRRALDRSPDSANAYALLGAALIQVGDGTGARSALSRALELDPSLVLAQQTLARLHADLGESEQAVQVGRLALRSAPQDTRLRLLVAENLLRLGRGAEGLAELDRIPESARDAEVYYAVGRLLQASGQWADARANLLKAHELDPGRFEPVSALFELDVREGRLDESAERIYAATLLQPTDARLMGLLGEVALRKGDIGPAEVAFRRAVELNPNDIAGYQNLARYMQQTGHPEQVLTTFEQASAANPHNAVAQLQLATLYEASGRRDDARARYEEALRLDPDLVVAMNNLAFLLAETGGDLDRALDLAQQAKTGAPQSPNIADTLGWVLFKKGIPGAAIGYLREAEQALQPGDPQLIEVRLHLALAQEANEEPEQARETVARALADLEALASASGNAASDLPWTAELQQLSERLGPGSDAVGEEG